MYNTDALEKIATEDFSCLEIPALRDRKEDLAALLNTYLEKYSLVHNKEVSYIETGMLHLLCSYNFPGNYEELEALLEMAVISATSPNLQPKDLALAFEALLQDAVKRSVGEYDSLEEAKRKFERLFYRTLLDKSDGDQANVASFLDIPRTVLAERLDNLID
jgi:transcriptional regulator with PAS, ATPase and Fis domain